MKKPRKKRGENSKKNNTHTLNLLNHESNKWNLVKEPRDIVNVILFGTLDADTWADDIHLLIIKSF